MIPKEKIPPGATYVLHTVSTAGRDIGESDLSEHATEEEARGFMEKALGYEYDVELWVRYMSPKGFPVYELLEAMTEEEWEEE